MSDLIIKPSGTNANFKVQNPSGTNKITMDSDGVTTIASNTTFSGTGNNIGTATAGTLGSGVTNNAGVASGTIASGVVFPSGTIITHTQYKSSVAVDSLNTSENVYTQIGNPMVFTKKKDSSTSKLFFHSHGKLFDAVGQSLSMGFKLRQGTNTSGTEIGGCDAYDLFHSNSTPHRTGRDLAMPCNEITNLGVGNHNFVITYHRYAYSAVAVSYWHLHIFEIMI